MYHFAKALYYSIASYSKNRKHKLFAQYHRAMALPSFGSRSICNELGRVHRRVDISVVITSFNYVTYIEEAIKSVIGSKIDNLSVELIVVDDASTDSSREVVKQFLEKAPIPMRLIRNYWNVGVSKSRNIGIAKANGEYIFILDADNFVYPDALQYLHQSITNACADAAYGPIIRKDLGGTTEGVVSNRVFDADFLYSTGNYIDAMALFRRSTLNRLGGYDVSLLKHIGGWEDYAMWLEFANQGCKVTFTPEHIGIYRVKGDSMVYQITPQEIEHFRHFATSRYSGFTAFRKTA